MDCKQDNIKPMIKRGCAALNDAIKHGMVSKYEDFYYALSMDEQFIWDWYLRVQRHPWARETPPGLELRAPL